MAIGMLSEWRKKKRVNGCYASVARGEDKVEAVLSLSCLSLVALLPASFVGNQDLDNKLGRYQALQFLQAYQEYWRSVVP